MAKEIRYTYSTHPTRDRAEAAIEDMFATSAVSYCEHPKVEHRKGRYAVTLVDVNMSAYL